jgi:hypothetical protein
LRARIDSALVSPVARRRSRNARAPGWYAGIETGDVGGLANNLGRGDGRAAAHRKQRGCEWADEDLEFLVHGGDLAGQLPAAFHQATGQAGHDAITPARRPPMARRCSGRHKVPAGGCQDGSSSCRCQRSRLMMRVRSATR